MAGTQVGIAFVLGMARAVFIQRFRHAPGMRADAVTRVAAFIDVVAQEEHEIEFTLRHLAVRHIVALLEMLA